MSDQPKIVVIDDSDIVLEATRMMLESHGFHVVTIDTPIGAAMSVAREQPKLVLVDLNMASMSGDRVVEALKKGQRTRGTPVLLYSGRSEEDLKEMAVRCGADGYVQKTEDADQLLKQLQPWLRNGA